MMHGQANIKQTGYSRVEYRPMGSLILRLLSSHKCWLCTVFWPILRSHS